jgi:hypothetical protein
MDPAEAKERNRVKSLEYYYTQKAKKAGRL